MSESSNVFHYQKVELDGEEEDEESDTFPHRQPSDSNLDRDREGLSKELRSTKPRSSEGRRRCCGRRILFTLLLCATLLSSAGIFGYLYSSYSKSNVPHPWITAGSEHSNASSSIGSTSSHTTKFNNISSIKARTSSRGRIDTSTTTDTLVSDGTSSTARSSNGGEHKPEWYKKYWDKYASPHRWDWLLLGLVSGISLAMGLTGILCLLCLCRSRRRMRRRHFERLLQDINATEKFSLVNSSDNEESDEN